MRVLLLPSDYAGQEVHILSQKERRYLMKVLRLRPGAGITARDAHGCYYEGVLLEDGSVRLKPSQKPEVSATDQLSGYRGSLPTIHLFQGLCKGRKNEDIARMACEAGVSGITFFTSAFCQQKELREHNAQRIESIMREAVQQSGSETAVRRPQVVSFTEALERAEGQILLLHQGVRTKGMLLDEAMARLEKDCEISLFVGSEGGISDEECALAEDRGAWCCLMRTNILRAETAGIFALGALENCLGW